METKSKFLIGAVLVLLVALPLMSTVLVASPYNNVSCDESNSTSSQNEKPRAECLERLIKGEYWKYGDLAKEFLKKAKNVTIEGTVITHFRNILVVQSGDHRLNILLPPIWSVNAEDKVANLTEVFSTYIKAGHMIEIKALERDFTNSNDVTISIIVAYEIHDLTSDNHLYAILPFNINP